jgi:hypothetical protein
MRAGCFVTAKKSSRTNLLNRREALPAVLTPLGAATVPGISARRSVLSVESYGVEDLSVER